MADYTLYYWPLPFRGQFVRTVLAHVQADWDEADVTAIAELRQSVVEAQPVPLMAPPVLLDHESNYAIAQMPAVLTYLGRRYDLIPEDIEREALTAKIVADANDALFEMTLHNGAQMWTQQTWQEYVPRLSRWMQIFEETGRRHGLPASAGTLLGTPAIGLADLCTYTLWHTLVAKFPALQPLLQANAPCVVELIERVAAQAEQAELCGTSDRLYGNAWCGGQIEASLRAVLDA